MKESPYPILTSGRSSLLYSRSRTMASGEELTPTSLCSGSIALFEDAVKGSPKKIALISCQGSLTYADLNERFNQLARHIRAVGGLDSKSTRCKGKLSRSGHRWKFCQKLHQRNSADMGTGEKTSRYVLMLSVLIFVSPRLDWARMTTWISRNGSMSFTTRRCHFIASLTELEKANVTGTVEVLRFASTITQKRLLYISILSVFCGATIKV